MASCRYADALAQFHNEEHLIKFEELLEAAIDLDKIPDEYLICASYDSGLQVYLLPMACAHTLFMCWSCLSFMASECLELLCEMHLQ